ncbi:monovalent cation/H+ antiporter subunit D [Pseudorhodobacter aquimaris]|uniref:monovalent cation/H+ antiporter subunit D n=1 Tax=Pseudorhodobacter aquimaris TaxID=687412 RepID=UPI00067D40F7|nr:monovalent cation/H+ antiporter subunit D [Pseudorhodobacter aquimaris]
MNHWIIAPVILPALLAPFIVLVMRHDLSLQRIFSTCGTVVLVGISLMLLYTAATNPPEVYFLGNWDAPFGIVLVLDRLSAMMVALTAILALLVQLYAIGTSWDARGNHFHALFQFQLMGLFGAFLTGDAFNLFVFFEVLLIASYGLMIHGGGAKRLKAGVQYVAFNLVGSTLFLFALATVYSVMGTLNMADLAVKMGELPPGDAALMRVGAVLLLLVFAVKGALVPLQFWLPATYSFAPGPVAALFAVMTKVGAYAVIRVYTLIFPPDTPATGMFFADLLLPAALVTLVVGAVGVMGATGLARLVAFAAIGSMGTLFIAISQFTPEAMSAALYYMIHSTLATAALFLIVDMVQDRRGTDTTRGSFPPFAQHGLLSALFFAGAIAMAGMPPLSGFLGKLLVMDATRGPDMAMIWTAILITSLITIVGFSRAGSQVFWKAYATTTGQARPEDKPEGLAFAMVFALLAGLVALTVMAGPVTDWLGETSAELFDRAAYIDAVLPAVKE